MQNITFQRLEMFLEHLFLRLPPLPNQIKQYVAVYIPLVVLIAAILSIINIILSLIETSTIQTLGLYNYYLSLIVQAILAVALLYTYRPLQARLARGWKSLFYLNSLFLFLSLAVYGIDNIVLVILIYYLLFQTKSFYI